MADRSSDRSEKIASDLTDLVAEGEAIRDLTLDAKPGDVLPFTARYHMWYTRALPVIKTLLPDRLADFRRQYERNDKRKTMDGTTYAIEDYIGGARPTAVRDSSSGQTKEPYDPNLVTYARVNNQVHMLSSVASRLSDALSNIRGVLQAGLFDSELDAARHLAKNGHLRAAGVVAGVVLEVHLAEVCDRHAVRVSKKRPHISDLNDALKKAEVFDTTNWRWVQRLADIRNLCDHKRERDPTVDEVTELLDGVDKAIKTLT